MSFRALIVGILAALILLPAYAQQPGAPAPQTPPTWPQKLTLQGQLVQTLGIPASQPGPVEVDVRVDGPPVIITLQGMAGELARQQGTGTLHLSYNLTGREVQSAPIVILTATLAQPQDPGVANVVVSARHPPADLARIASLTQSTDLAKSVSEGQQRQAAARAQYESNEQAQRQQLEQARSQQHAALFAQMQPAAEQLRQGHMSTRALGPIGIKRPPPGPPAISGLSINGQPVSQLHIGDPVFINGSGFGTTPFEVHFIMGAGNDLIADAKAGLVWTDSQIYAIVPTPSAPLAGFSATVYVKRADGAQSAGAGFTFVPPLDYRTIWVTGVLADGIYTRYPQDHLYTSGGGITRWNSDCWSGKTGIDQLYPNTRLKNQWVVRGAPSLTYISAYPVGATPFAWTPTNSPALSVLWSIQIGFACFNYLTYSLAIPIQGPLGLPDGIVVP